MNFIIVLNCIVKKGRALQGKTMAEYLSGEVAQLFQLKKKNICAEKDRYQISAIEW